MNETEKTKTQTLSESGRMQVTIYLDTKKYRALQRKLIGIQPFSDWVRDRVDEFVSK